MRTHLQATGLALMTTAGLASVMGISRNSKPNSEKISGSAELKYAEQRPLRVPEGSGYQLVAGETRGVNKNTGGGDFMSDAPVVNAEIANLSRGNGTHEGYYTMAKGADTLTAKWAGKVTTTMVNNQPNTTFAGTWEYIYGTGKYAGGKGKGTYKGQFLAKDRYAVSWEGNYQK